MAQVVEAGLGLERAQHFPAGVVEHQHDRVPAVTFAVTQLPTGHLKGTVTHQNQRALAGGGLQAQTGGHTKPHGGVIAGGHQCGVLDFHRGEQAVTHVRGNRHLAVSGHQVIHSCGDVGWCDARCVQGQACREALRCHAERLVCVGHPFQHAVDHRSQWQVGVGVVANVDLTVERLNGLAHVDLGLGHGKVGVADDLTQQKQAV